MHDYPLPNFDSARLRAWRTREIEPHFAKAVETIGKTGWQVMTVFSENVADNFAYTAGVYDILGLPELITVGLPADVGAHALNAAVGAMRSGSNLLEGTHRDILGGDIEVEFLPVAAKWLHHLMLRADWYYEGEDVPVLQLVYPDLSNRFQWEEGFESRFRQPIFASGYPEQELEKEFWDINSPQLNPENWCFPHKPIKRVYSTPAVKAGKEVIKYVSHEDGDWLFLGESDAEEGSFVRSRLAALVNQDSSLEQLADLPPGWYAEREAPGKPWQLFQHEPAEGIGDEQD